MSYSAISSNLKADWTCFCNWSIAEIGDYYSFAHEVTEVFVEQMRTREQIFSAEEMSDFSYCG